MEQKQIEKSLIEIKATLNSAFKIISAQQKALIDLKDILEKYVIEKERLAAKRKTFKKKKGQNHAK